MTVALFDTAQISAVADAIRAKTGKAEQMTVGQMPAEIASIQTVLPMTEKEVWLHPYDSQNSLVIDTGIPADMEHTLEVIGFGNIYSTTTLFGSYTAAGRRQSINWLTTQNAIRWVWAGSGLRQYNYDISQLSLWLPMKTRFNKNGFSVTGFNSTYNPVTISEDCSAFLVGEASAENYHVFHNLVAHMAEAQPGVFRSAKIMDANENLLHHLVPILKSDWSLVLRDKVTGSEIPLPTGADGYGAQWEPYTDNLILV